MQQVEHFAGVGSYPTFTPLAGEVHKRVQTRDALWLPRTIFFIATALTGEQTLRPLFGITVSDDLLLLSLVLTVVAVASSDEVRQGSVPSGILWGLQLFALGAMISAFGSPSPLGSLGILMRFAFVIIAWVWLASTLLHTQEHVRLAIGCWVASIAFSGIAAIAQLLWGDVIPGTSIAWGRATGFAQHVNDLGGMTAVAAPAAVWLATTARTMHTRLLAIAAGLLIGAGLLLSGSVGGLLAAGAGGLAYLILSGMSRRAVALLLVTVIAAVGLVQLQASHGSVTPLERIQAVQRQGGTVSTRIETFDSAFNRIAENPFIGVGLGAGSRESGTDFAIHNMLLGTWFEAGIAALFGLIFLTANVLVFGLGGYRLTISGSDRLICAALIAAFVGYLAFGMGAPTLFARYGWMPATLLIAWTLQLQRQESDREAAGKDVQA
jgi:O-antigen ligase